MAKGEKRRSGGGRGIRTPDNGLANRRLQPLGHPSAGTRRMRKPFYRPAESESTRTASGLEEVLPDGPQPLFDALAQGAVRPGLGVYRDRLVHLRIEELL